jgi:hypothetical protein
MATVWSARRDFASGALPRKTGFPPRTPWNLTPNDRPTCSSILWLLSKDSRRHVTIGAGGRRSAPAFYNRGGLAQALHLEDVEHEVRRRLYHPLQSVAPARSDDRLLAGDVAAWIKAVNEVATTCLPTPRQRRRSCHAPCVHPTIRCDTVRSGAMGRGEGVDTLVPKALNPRKRRHRNRKP